MNLSTTQLIIEKMQSQYWMVLWKIFFWDLTPLDDIINNQSIEYWDVLLLLLLLLLLLRQVFTSSQSQWSRLPTRRLNVGTDNKWLGVT